MQPRAQSHALVALLVSVMILADPQAARASSCKDRDVLPSMSNVSRVQSAVHCLLNHERTSRALPALKPNRALTKAAQRHGANMVRKRFFSHVAPDGRTAQSRIRAAGYRGNYLGENIAWGSGGSATPRQTVINWMSSRGHRRNILGPSFRDVGVGMVLGGPRGEPGVTYATTFGGGR